MEKNKVQNGKIQNDKIQPDDEISNEDLDKVAGGLWDYRPGDDACQTTAHQPLSPKGK